MSDAPLPTPAQADARPGSGLDRAGAAVQVLDAVAVRLAALLAQMCGGERSADER